MFVIVQPSQRRLYQETCGSSLDNTLIVLGEEDLPFIYRFECVGGDFSEKFPICILIFVGLFFSGVKSSEEWRVYVQFRVEFVE